MKQTLQTPSFQGMHFDHGMQCCIERLICDVPKLMPLDYSPNADIKCAAEVICSQLPQVDMNDRRDFTSHDFRGEEGWYWWFGGGLKLMVIDVKWATMWTAAAGKDESDNNDGFEWGKNNGLNTACHFSFIISRYCSRKICTHATPIILSEEGALEALFYGL